MNNQVIEDLEARLTNAGRTFQYPPTPDIAGISTARMWSRHRAATLRLAITSAIIVLLLVVLLAVPPVRAQILEFIQIGIVRIFLAASSPTAPLPTLVEPSKLSSTATQPVQPVLSSATPQPAPLTPTAGVTLLPSLLDLVGETTLAEAQSKLTFHLLLPTFPTDLGLPDRVFLQDTRDQMLVLIWLSPDEPDKIALSLHMFDFDDSFVSKWEPKNIVETRVSGQPAIWAEGPYLFRLTNGELAFDRLIEGHVLVWTIGDLTYRLETDRSLDEALKIAESLAPQVDQLPQPGAGDGTNP